MTARRTLPDLHRAILTLLKTKGHAMWAYEIKEELGKRFIGVNTYNKLRFFGCIQFTNQGMMITDLGKDTLEKGEWL
jgi:hypothetical protein